MDVFVGGRAPAPLRATISLRPPADGQPAENARWTLRASSEGLDPAVFTGQSGGTLMRFSARGDGVGGSANLRGEWQQGDNRVVVQPSQLQLREQTLHAQPLVIDALDGRITSTAAALSSRRWRSSSSRRMRVACGGAMRKAPRRSPVAAISAWPGPARPGR